MFVFFLVIVAHLIALFSSPAFSGPRYSTKILIDEYCANSSNGSSLVMKSKVSYDEEKLNKIVQFKETNDTDLNTVLGLSLDGVDIGGANYTFVGSKSYKANYIYNNYRIYSYTNWSRLSSNCLYISEPIASVFAPDSSKPIKDVINKEVEATINGTVYKFKIGGVYNTNVTNDGWRSRGKYFSDSFSNCIFIDESFLSDKFNTVFEMFTSVTAESGTIYKRYSELINSIHGEQIYSNIQSELELQNAITLLDNKRRNSALQGVVISVSVIALLFTLSASIYLFDTGFINKPKKGYLTLCWCLAFGAFSYLFVFLAKKRMIKLFGYFAYGANTASLNIILLFLLILFIALSMKTYFSMKKVLKNSMEVNEAKKQEVLFITKAKFPDANAFATYIGSLASVFDSLGYDVTCVGNGDSDYQKGFESYFGKYVSCRKVNNNSKILKIMNQLFFESRVLRHVKKNVKHPVHVFFSCEYSLSFYERVKDLFSDFPVKYSFIVTEEYTKDEFEKYNILSKRSYKLNSYFVNKYENKKDSFVVISRFLQDKISNRGIKCVYVPFSFNLTYIQSNLKEKLTHEGINFIYCGNPENKDLLPIIINAFSTYSSKTNTPKIHLNIIGVDEQWAEKHGVTLWNKEVISFLGRRDKEFVFNSYAQSDYSVLLRDETKVFAKAGFPTKISESMILGVVPITNLTSNLSEYLTTNNSIIVKDSTTESFLEAIDKSVKDFKSNSSRSSLAKKTASENFNIEKYKGELSSLIDNET